MANKSDHLCNNYINGTRFSFVYIDNGLTQTSFGNAYFMFWISVVNLNFWYYHHTPFFYEHGSNTLSRLKLRKKINFKTHFKTEKLSF